jgi:hypothetical protein
LASANGDVSRLVLGTAVVQHDVKALAKPCGDLFVADAAVGVDEGWVQVGRGGRFGRESSSSLQKEGLERSLTFKRWARGRCFRCLERGHQISSCRGPFSVVVVLVIESVSAMPLVLALRTLLLVLRMLVLIASRAALCPLSLLVPRCPGVGLRSSATHHCVLRRRQGPLLGVASSSMSFPVWTLSFSLSLP